jgi:hypothetical protein
VSNNIADLFDTIGGIGMAIAARTGRPDPGSGGTAVSGAPEATALLEEARKRGLLGAKDRQLGGRFPSALVEAAQAATGITEVTDLLTYALARVAFEDNYGRKLLELEGTVPPGTFDEY